MQTLLRGYGVAAVSVLVATVVRLALHPYLGNRGAFLTLIIAVLVSAWYGGWGPSVFAVVASSLSASYFFLQPADSMLPRDGRVALQLVFFCCFGLAIGWISRSMRRRSAQVRRARETFLVTLASIADGVIATDREGRITFLNLVAEQLTGWTQAEAEGQPLDSVYRIADATSGLDDPDLQPQALGEDHIVGLTDYAALVAKDGTQRAIEDHCAPILDGDGRSVGVVLVFRDVTEKRLLEVQRGRLAAMVDSSEDAILVKSFDGVVIDWNLAAARLFGYSASEVVGKSIFSTIVPADHKQELLDALQRVRQGQIVQPFETVRRRKDGRRLPMSVRISPIRDVRGRIVAASAIDRDISQQRSAERRRAARLAVMQILAQTGSIEEAAPRILDILCTALEWQAACLWRVDPAQSVLRCEAFWKPPSHVLDTFENATRQRTFAVGNSLPGRVWARGEPCWVPDVAADGAFLRTAQAAAVGLHGGFACPIMVGADFYGVIEFFSHQIQEPDDDLREMMATIGNQIGRYIERGQAQKALRDSERLYRAIGESIDFGVWVCDPEGQNIYLSDSFLRLVGMTQQQCAGFGWTRALHPDDTPRTIAAWQQCVRSMGQWDEEHRIRGTDGQYHPVLSRGVPVRNETGQVVCWAGINLDVSRIRHAEDALREADRRKNEFLAMLAHELRNPLAPIRSGLDILAIDPGNHQQTVDLMQEQLTHIVRLVDDLLDLSRIMRGRVELRKEAVELAGIVDRSISAVRPLMQDQQQELTVSLPEPSVWLDADPVRLTQVIENLLTNAAKYSSPGGHIQLTATSDRDQLALSVQDDGMGIEADLLPNVFELFTQSARSLDRAQGGLGIGLTLVRNLVEMHGGTVTAHSDGPGRGSTFVVRLPMIEAVPERVVAAPPPTIGEGRQVLVVDDNRSAVWMLSKLIKMIGDHRVETAADGPSALAQALKIHPDVILLDIGLPGMDGLEVGRRLREQPEFDDCLLVALTGYGQEDDRRRSEAAGFDEHLVKPPSVEQIRGLLAHPKLVRP